MNQLPESVVKKLEEERERLDRSFSRIWGLLSPSVERDEVMWHIISAKRTLHVIIKENKGEEKGE